MNESITNITFVIKTSKIGKSLTKLLKSIRELKDFIQQRRIGNNSRISFHLSHLTTHPLYYIYPVSYQRSPLDSEGSYKAIHTSYTTLTTPPKGPIANFLQTEPVPFRQHERKVKITYTTSSFLYR